MQIFKTGRQVTQVVKNMQRLRVILGTFGRHGFDEFLARMDLQRYMPSTSRAEGVENLTVAERLRMAAESLGPTFVKLGQALANRPDMVPENFVEEFKKLQDNVAPLPFEVIRAVVETELGASIEDRFASFGSTPLASASIAQVHEARLKSGEDVVIKVQRPDIEKTIRNDVSVLMFLAQLMEKYMPETRIIGPVRLAEEFFTTLNYELDFAVEANTTQKVAENFKDNPHVVIPKVYREYSSHRLLTLEHLRGVRITEVQRLHEMGINPTELVDIGARAFFKMLMQDGLFHGDLHGGNLFALKDLETGQAKVGVIDFGIVGRLSPSARDALSRIVLALVTEDYENLCYEYAELGSISAGVDFEAFQREVRNSLSPYMGLSLKDVNAGQVLINSTRIALRYNIRIPGDWMIVFKAIFSLEGLGRQLDADFDFLSLGGELVKDVAKERFSLERITKDIGWLARDVGALIQVAPRQIRWMFRKFNSNDFAFEIQLKDMEVLRRQIERSFRGLSLSALSASFFIASAICTHIPSEQTWQGYPVPAIVFFALGLSGFASLMLKGWK
ncbi:MAG: AarF/ABC1/UbiB kinase family protein [Deltaproteobacteria bacterium]|nr:AarF/ABC1/UbiB kinase family protein [Deltaproteobacteria bacterium]